MANLNFRLPDNPAVAPNTPILVRLVDNGDGSFGIGGTSAYGAALASAARAATTNSDDIANPGGRVLQVAVALTTFTNAVNVVPSIQAKDPTTGLYRTILTGTAMTGTGATWLVVGPEITASANNFARDIVPAIWRLVVTHTGTNPTTYSAGWSVT